MENQNGNTESQLKLLQLDLQRLDTYFNLATVKASLIIPANAVLIGLTMGNQEDYSKLLAGTSWSWLTNVTFIGIMLTAGISTVLSMLVVKAFLRGGETPGGYSSLIYFGSIKKMTVEAFIEKVEAVSEKDFIEDLARQVHLLSNSLTTKFQLTNWSIYFLALAIIQTLLVAFVHVVSHR